LKIIHFQKKKEKLLYFRISKSNENKQQKIFQKLVTTHLASKKTNYSTRSHHAHTRRKNLTLFYNITPHAYTEKE